MGWQCGVGGGGMGMERVRWEGGTGRRWLQWEFGVRGWRDGMGLEGRDGCVGWVENVGWELVWGEGWMGMEAMGWMEWRWLG